MQLFVNDLTVIDFSYLCRQRGIVGESWIVDVLLDGDLNDQSMVLDFSIVKKQIKAIIDDAVDHKLLLPMLEPALRVTGSEINKAHEFVDFTSEKANFHLQSPTCAFAKIHTDVICIESVTKHLKNIILEQLPTNVKNLMLTLRPEVSNSDYYHYTHGLKKHDGNCQRIAHGHRSTIQLFKDNLRDNELESYWCERWRDIYIATDTDEVSKADVQLSGYAVEHLKPDHRFFAYEAPQGRFDIAVQETVLEVVDCDSTVELLADYIARQLKAQNAAHQIKVVAYEGVGKGAIASV